MEHRVQLAISGQLEAISYKTNLGRDLKGPIEMRNQFMRGALNKGLLPIRMQLEVNPITNFEMSLSAFLVNILFHPVMCSRHVRFE